MARENARARAGRRLAGLGGRGRLADQILGRTLPLGRAEWIDPAKYPWQKIRTADDWLRAELAARKILVADNVARFYFEHERQTWLWKSDFPAARPPFGSCWIETVRPAQIRFDDGLRIPPSTFPNRWGALVDVIANPDPTGVPEHVGELRDQIAETRPALVVQYSLISPGLSHTGEEVLDPTVLIWPFCCDAEGNVLADPMVLFPSPLAKPEYETKIDEIAQDCHQLIQPLMLAFSLCNCRNVSLVETAADPALDRRRRREGLRPLIRHSTIKIEPGPRVRRPAGAEADEHAPPRAQHDVRGHMAYYSEDRPLFGRSGLHGRFWIPDHVRGLRAAGRVVSRYDVRPEKEGDGSDGR